MICISCLFCIQRFLSVNIHNQIKKVLRKNYCEKVPKIKESLLLKASTNSLMRKKACIRVQDRI